MTTSTARTRLLKIVRLRPADCPFPGKACASRFPRVRPTARISPVSMRSFGRPRAPSRASCHASPSDIPVQHHPQKFHASVEQSVGKTAGDALRSASRVYDEQDTLKGAPEGAGGEHLSRHRRVEQDHVPALLEGPHGADEL